MTVVGKILVFLNFFMALVFLGMVFSAMNLIRDPKTGESWRELYVKEQQKVQKQGDDGASGTKLQAAAAEEIKKVRDELQTERTARASEKAQHDQDLAAERNKSADVAAKFAQSQLLVDQLNGELKVRRDEVTQLTRRLSVAQAEVSEKAAEVTKAMNEAAQAKFSRDTFKSRMDDLGRQVQELTAALERERQSAAQTGVATNAAATEALASRPPPEDVRGEVKEVGANGLLAISIGSDQGLLRGHTLEVYRLDPKPQYLGKMRILEVEPGQAVGKLLSPQYNKLVQPKDIVSNRIMYNK
jgi:uncharacterized phage infection (PIP) family protein YhgE